MSAAAELRRSASRLGAIARKELVQMRRDRLTLAMMIALPVMQLLLFGYAIDTDVRHIPLVVYDQDRSAASRDFARSLQATTFYDLVGQVGGYPEIERALRRGIAGAALVVPKGFASDLTKGLPANLQLVVDGSDPQTVGSAIDTAVGLAEARSAKLLAERAGPKGLAPISVTPITWYNPRQESAVFIVPGLVGVLLTMTLVMLTAMALARERERGTIEQLVVSPLRRGELMVGKILPYVAVGYVQMTLILALGVWVFHVPLAGSLALLYLLALVFIAANLSLGLLFSSLAKTQQQAMQMSFFFLLPNILLSGFMFPWSAMPKAVQWISEVLPLTHFLRIVRGVLLKGARFTDLLGELAWLSAILLVLLVVMSLRFRKKLA